MESHPMGLRFAGMTIGVLVSFASAWVPFDAVGLSGLFGPLGIGLAGAPVAALLGWWLSPHIASSSWRNAIAIGFGAGLLAPPLGLLEFLYVMLVAGLAEGPAQLQDTVAGLVFIGMYGLGYCWVVLPITIPSGIVAAMIVRGLLPRSRGALSLPHRSGFATRSSCSASSHSALRWCRSCSRNDGYGTSAPRMASTATNSGAW